uniref:Uncharacterized protein n=1 Tax=Arundo donax TaxID=35708 RepID=A0A0A8ZTE0_ARUDO
MAVGALLRGLVSPAGGVAAWLPCHELLASPSSSSWLPSLTLPRLRPRLQASPRSSPLLRRPSRGPLHRLLLHGPHAPPRRPRCRREGSLLLPPHSLFSLPPPLATFLLILH